MALKNYENSVTQITDEMIEFAENMAKHPKEAKKIWSQSGSPMIIDWAKRISEEVKRVAEVDFLLYAKERREKEILQNYFGEGIKIVKRQLLEEKGAV